MLEEFRLWLIANPIVIDFCVLLVIYQIKHYLCDYPLQNEYMLGKFKPGFQFIAPLAFHSGAHGVGTFLISSVYLYQKDSFVAIPIILLCCFDFISHFVMDRIKASPNLLGRYHPLSPTEYKDLIQFEMKEGPDAQTIQDKKHNKLFWWSVGLDQGVHHLTHYSIMISLLYLAYH